jgi:uncharacterized membrane protein
MPRDLLFGELLSGLYMLFTVFIMAAIAWFIVTLFRIEKHLKRISDYCDWHTAVEGKRFSKQFPPNKTS